LLGDPEELFAYTGFATQQSSYAYIVTGSFSRYLIDRFGVKSFKEVFPAAHFVESYGLPLHALIDDWENFLRTVDASSLPSETISTLFAQQSIFRKTCARVTAERNARAVQAIRVKDYSEAENEFSASFDDAQTAFALRGMYLSLLAGKKYDRIVDSYNDLNERSMLRYNPGILFLLADALWLQGNVLRSLEVFRRIEEMKYSEAYTKNAAFRRVIVGDPGLNQQLRDYFYGSAPDSVRAAIVTRLLRSAESRVVGQYLQADEYYRTKQFAEAGEEYRAIVPAFSDEVLSYFCAMNAARALYRAGKFEEAKGMFWQAQNFTQSPTMVKQIDEWIERCDAVAKQID
jgi:tetratricopeptide (TPR) repeat protein